MGWMTAFPVVWSLFLGMYGAKKINFNCLDFYDFVSDIRENAPPIFLFFLGCNKAHMFDCDRLLPFGRGQETA